MKAAAFRTCSIPAVVMAMTVAIGIGSGAVRAQGRADTPTNPFAHDPAAAAAGGKLFDAACSACHGPGASGGRGPALNTGSFAHGGEDFDIFTTIENGVAAGGMPSFKGLDTQDVWRLVTYISSLSAAGGGGAKTKADPAAVARGEALFFGKGQCASCHEVNGRGAFTAADLSAIGHEPASRIRAALDHVLRPARGAPTPRVAQAIAPDGRPVRGYVRFEDTFRIGLAQPDGQVLLFDKAKLRNLAVAPGAAAPTDISQRLSAAEVSDVVAYLSQQTGRKVDGAIPPSGASTLPAERIVRSTREPQNWPTYWGDYQGQHFSGLAQIDRRNVAGLQAQWSANLAGEAPLEATPIVVDGVMYVSGAPGEVYALDAKTGLRLWAFSRKQDRVNPFQINPTNRGVAVLDGRVFVGTLDDMLIALDARTGRPLWERRVADTMLGYSITGAPLAVPGKVMVGIGGGEYAIRGFLEAYDPATGKRLWRFNSIPEPGQPGNDTWAGESWKNGGGGAWLTGSYDPQQNLVLWSVGNPAPSFDPNVRKGDNLFTDSVLAIDADSGKLKWHYQFTPNDSHDWDSTEDLVLADQLVDGRPRKLLLHADRNGFFYRLDRTTGRFLGATPYVRQNWNDGFDADGRPKVRPESVATPQGVPVFPAVGGTNYQAPSYDQRRGVFYVEFVDSQGYARYSPAEPVPGRTYRAEAHTPPPMQTTSPRQGVVALDAATGKPLWTFLMSRVSLGSGVLATRGDLVFAASGDGMLVALDAHSGEPLWSFRTDGMITASPMAYAVDGRQYVAIAAGASVYTFALPPRPAGGAKRGPAGR